MIRGRHVLAGAVMLLSLAALSVWCFMPIYPDEIAFRAQVSRYIQDQGLMNGLYALCASNIKQTPFLFVVPALILSWLDLTLSPVAMRALPFVTVIATVVFAVWYAVRGANPLAALMAATAFIGVAGSGLVMARYEYVQEVNILSCLGAFLYLERGPSRSNLRYVLMALLMTSCLLSVYAHIQGLLFLPLTAYLAYKMFAPDLGKPRSFILMVALFLYITVSGVLINNSSCDEYPEIAQFWAEMTFSLKGFNSSNLIEWLLIKFDKYQISFTYEKIYAVNYLPGIDVKEVWQQVLIAILNQSIECLLLINILLTFGVAFFMPVYTVWKNRSQTESLVATIFAGFNHAKIMVPTLLALPVVFLYFYDTSQNFYRSFFLNFVAAIVLALVLSRARLAGLRPLANLYFGLSAALVLASVVANMTWFMDKLHAITGYEGPSISLQRNWRGVQHDVTSLAQSCGMDLSRGRIVLDDMTYDSLKLYPNIYPITYLSLQAEITKLGMSEVISKVRPNYAIARCGSMQYTKIGYQHQRGELCCLVFNEHGKNK